MACQSVHSYMGVRGSLVHCVHCARRGTFCDLVYILGARGTDGVWRTSGLYRVQFDRDTGTEFRRTNHHVTLGSEVVDLIRSNLPQMRNLYILKSVKQNI